MALTITYRYFKSRYPMGRRFFLLGAANTVGDTGLAPMTSSMSMDRSRTAQLAPVRPPDQHHAPGTSTAPRLAW